MQKQAATCDIRGLGCNIPTVSFLRLASHSLLLPNIPCNCFLNIALQVNADELAAAATARGWDVDVHDFATMPFTEQLQAASTASIMIGSHGAAFAALTFTPRDAVSIELLTFGFR